MLEEHVRTESIFKAMERSIHSARFVFNEYFYQTHKTKFVEYALLDSWYQFLTDEDKTGFNLDADMICKYFSLLSWFQHYHVQWLDFLVCFDSERLSADAHFIDRAPRQLTLTDRQNKIQR